MAFTPSFGLLFDIDGVIVRGRKVLPSAPDAFRKLVDDAGKFRIPTVFVTNAGNYLRLHKAQQLTHWLGIKVREEQVVMAHSPLKLFHQFHNKHVLVSGQGPVVDIARNLGFTKVTTVDDLRKVFPVLDAVDHERRLSVPCTHEQKFPRIEAVVLFGEPVRWETALQLLIDVLMTSGLPSEAPESIPLPHLPVLACNMDLQWMAEACMPRFGHGSFLLCLENLYKKITGRDLIYSALIGKPSEITYRHADYCIQDEAQYLGLGQPIKNLYCIGDNICTDIYGSNLYNQYLSRQVPAVTTKRAEIQGVRSLENMLGRNSNEDVLCAEHCYSVLVETGVYSQERNVNHLDHSPRDFLPVEEKLRQPSFTAKNVLQAINLIFEREGFQ